MARITVAPPRTMSPPANITGIDVLRLSSTQMVPRDVTSSPSILFGIRGIRRYSHAHLLRIDVYFFDCAFHWHRAPPRRRRVRRVPFAGLPRAHAASFVGAYSIGLQRVRNSTPSSLAWCTSSIRAGISASLRRYIIMARSAPMRRAVRTPVHRGVAAAYHCHAPARVGAGVSYPGDRLIRVDAGQIFVARQHADIVLPGMPIKSAAVRHRKPETGR